MKNTRRILVLGILVFAVSIAGMVANAYLATHPTWGIFLDRWALSVTVIAIALITFFGFMWCAEKQGGNWALNAGGMRLAIVITVFTVYLLLVGMISLFRNPGEVPELARTILTHFTTVVITVVAFYFSSSAYVQVREKKKNGVTEWKKVSNSVVGVKRKLRRLPTLGSTHCAN